MKHEKDERSALFEYLDDNDCTIYSYGEAQNEVHELETILEGLQKYDSPDMYAIVGNMLVIIEHFAFDASRETKRKGMERIRKDREAHAKMWADVMNGNIPAVIVTQARETLSLHTWQMNFEKHFGSHYAKIGQYIENAKKAANMEQSIETEEIVRCKTGFFIEEEFPPILDVNGTLREVRYIETKQFLDFFRDKIKVDFILFGTQYNGHSCIFYIDHRPTKSSVERFFIAVSVLSYANYLDNGYPHSVIKHHRALDLVYALKRPRVRHICAAGFALVGDEIGDGHGR